MPVIPRPDGQGPIPVEEAQRRAWLSYNQGYNDGYTKGYNAAMISKAKNNPRRPISSEYTAKQNKRKNYNHHPKPPVTFEQSSQTSADNSLQRVPTPFPHYPQLDSFVPK